MAVGLGLAAVQSASAFQMDFSSIPSTTGANKQGGFLQFTGATSSSAASVTFLNAGNLNTTAPGYQFKISAVNGGNLNGSAVGDVGKLGGTFTVTHYSATTNAAPNTAFWDPVTKLKPKNVVVTETVTVTGTGSLTIKDHAGLFLTGSATLDNLTDTFTAKASNSSTPTLSALTYTSTGFTGNGPVSQGGYQLNVTGMTYSGTEADLISLAAGDRPGPLGHGRAQLGYTWQIPPVGGSLLALTKLNAGIHKETFSGSIQSDAHPIPDGGVTLALLGAALSGVALVRRGKAA